MNYTAMHENFIKKFVITLVIVVSVILAYSILMKISKIQVTMLGLVLSSIFILAGWFISAIRLKYILSIARKNVKCPLRTCLEARFMGDVLAKITPSSIGGEPARAYHIAVKTGMSFVEAYALAIYEVYFDVILTCVMGVLVSIWFLPLGMPILITSLTTGILWFFVFKFLGRIELIRVLRCNYLAKIQSNQYFRKLWTYITDFRNHYVTVATGNSFWERLIIWFLTILIHMLWAIAIIPLMTDEILSPLLVVNGSAFIQGALSAYFLMQAISILPTPGGSGVSEYGLSLALRPDIVVVFRALYYFIPIIIGLILVFGNAKLGRRIFT